MLKIKIVKVLFGMFLKLKKTSFTKNRDNTKMCTLQEVPMFGISFNYHRYWKCVQEIES